MQCLYLVVRCTVYKLLTAEQPVAPLCALYIIIQFIRLHSHVLLGATWSSSIINVNVKVYFLVLRHWLLLLSLNLSYLSPLHKSQLRQMDEKQDSKPESADIKLKVLQERKSIVTYCKLHKDLEKQKKSILRKATYHKKNIDFHSLSLMPTTHAFICRLEIDHTESESHFVSSFIWSTISTTRRTWKKNKHRSSRTTDVDTKQHIHRAEVSCFKCAATCDLYLLCYTSQSAFKMIS